MMQSNDDFAALSKRYWQAWTEGLSSAGPAFDVAGANPWRRAMDAWVDSGWVSQRDVDAAMGQFTRLSGDWMGRMQALAAQFAGKQPSAGDIAQAWKSMLGQDGVPWQPWFQAMPGAQSLYGMGQAWLPQGALSPHALLELPTIGFSREHQQRLQQLMQAQLRVQERLVAWQAMLNQSVQEAVVRFERKLSQHAVPGKQIDSVRALFDLWVDAAEEAYAQMALSKDYRSVYAALVNAQMQVRADAQAIQEQVAAAMGLPGRTELDSAHRKLAELERAMRRVQRSASAEASPVAAERAPARKPAQAGAAPAKPPHKVAAKPAKTPAANAASQPATVAATPRSGQRAPATKKPAAAATSASTRRAALPEIRMPGVAASARKGSKRR